MTTVHHDERPPPSNHHQEQQKQEQQQHNLMNLFIIPLQDPTPPTIFQHDYLEKFASKVFSTILEIKDHHQSFLNQIIKPENTDLIPQLILTFALRWSNLYTSYAKDHPLGEFQIEKQMILNPLFAELIESIPKRNVKKKDFRHFYSRPTLRLVRYSLLLNRLIENTPKDHVDFNILTSATDLIKNQCRECNTLIELQQDRLKLLKLHKSIINKHDYTALHLKAPSRRLYCSGEMIKKKEGSLNNFMEVNGILIDHYFIITKPIQKSNPSITYHEIIEEPIRLEFMKLSKTDDQLAHKKVNKLKSFLHNNSNLSFPNQPLVSNSLFPITFQSFGVSPRTITIYLENEKLRSFWVDKFNEAIHQRLQNFEQIEVFKLLPILNFTTTSSHQLEFHAKLEEFNSLFNRHSADEHLLKQKTPRPLHGIPTCSAQFISQDGNNYLVIGCQKGLWIGKKHQPNSFHFILPNLKNIQQCEVLMELNQIVVLSNSQLFLYPLNQFLQKSSTRDRSNSSPLIEKPSRPCTPYGGTTTQTRALIEPSLKSYYDSNLHEFRNLKKSLNRSSFNLVKKSDSTSSSSSSSSSNSNSTSSSSIATTFNSYNFDSNTSNPNRNIISSDTIIEERKSQQVRENQRNFRRSERAHEMNLPVFISESNKEVSTFKIGRLTDHRTILTCFLDKFEIDVEKLDSGCQLIVLEMKMIDSFPNFTQLKKINLQFKRIQEIKLIKDQLMIIESSTKQFMIINLSNSRDSNSTSNQEIIKTFSVLTKNDLNLLANQRFKKLIKTSHSLLNSFEVEDGLILFCFDRFGYFGNIEGIRDKSKPILQWESNQIKSFKISFKKNQDDRYLIMIGSNSMIEIWDLIKFEKIQEIFLLGLNSLCNLGFENGNDDLVIQVDELSNQQQIQHNLKQNQSYQKLYQIDEDQHQDQKSLNHRNAFDNLGQNSSFKVLQLFQL
ncbi:uncharacterized protein MELLADRAFT_116206 [Melampsora larici-populina 98AG31]|uniref:DH domain-containing protein n=1 Tax=Melampsora larici-populina (strain 98AG31 / pathotype 3-4-7) TaxID=747676 RepID=F4RIV1_MELLP|nr:uncharacterized protein MELLADRAFT_116206 [Melampsora larici-populina 98AG31]EGG07767.1 hypothetical protein MELLADRAFT_116206 [Melampsora larici-populina 98AG31]